MFCLIVAADARGSAEDVAAAQQECNAIEKELIAVIRKRETSPERKALDEARAAAGQAFRKAAISEPEVAALEAKKKNLDAMLVELRKKRREEEAGQGTDKEILKTINQNISNLEVERRKIKGQIRQKAMTLPSLEGTRKNFLDIEEKIKQFKAEQTPEMKEIKERLDAARNRLSKLRVELSEGKEK